MKTKVIDASRLEGGGQVVRIAATLSALTSIPIELHNIRGNRSGGGGLKGQHLAAIQWLSKACNAHVEGLELKSRTLVFKPGRGNTPKREIDWLLRPTKLKDGSRALEATVSLETNGATTLVLQTLLPYLIFHPPTHPDFDRSNTPIILTVHGGTNVTLSPSIDYLLFVFSPNLVRLGIQSVELVSLRRGYTTGARSGLGSVSLLIHPLPPGTKLPDLVLPPSISISRQGTVQSASSDSTSNPTQALESIGIHILAPSPAAIAALRSATLALVRETFFPTLASTSSSTHSQSTPTGPSRIQIHSTSSADPSNKRFYLLLAGKHASGWTLGADWLYDGRGLRSNSNSNSQRSRKANMPGQELPADVLERVAGEMAERVVGELRALLDEGRAMDRWMEDQVVVFAALAGSGTETTMATGKPAGSKKRKTAERSAGGADEDGRVNEGEDAGGASLHTVTARWIANELLGVEFNDNGECQGIGLKAA